MDKRFEQTAVSRAVWPWMGAQGTPSDSGTRRRRRAGVQFLVAGTVAALVYWGLGSAVMGTVVLSIGVFVLFCGLFVPRLFHGIERVFRAFGRFVGHVLTWILLVPFFYLVFVPARLILVLTGKDPMNRKLADAETSYWTVCRNLETSERHTKQY